MDGNLNVALIVTDSPKIYHIRARKITHGQNEQLETSYRNIQIFIHEPMLIQDERANHHT